jgi:hypothetical protein
MTEQILGASGFFLANVTSAGKLSVDASVNASVNFDPIAGSPGANFPGSVIMLGGIDSATGSVGYFTSTNNKLDTNATVSMTGGSAMVIYSGALANIAQVTGGRLYTNVLGSVEVSNISAVNTDDILGSVQLQPGTSTIGSVIVDIQKVGINVPIIGSVAITNTLSVATGSGMCIYSGDVTNVANVSSGRLLTSPLGSVQLTTGTSIIGSIAGISASLPVGGNILGSVVVDIQKVGLNVPIIGSVQLTTGTSTIGSIAGIKESLPAGANLLGSVKAAIMGNTAGAGTGNWVYALVDGDGNFQVDIANTPALGAGTALIGSANVKITADGTAMLGSVKIGAIPVGTNIIGSIAGISESLPVGTNLIGSVKVGAIPVGTNIIGSVAVDIQKVGINVPVVGSVQLSGYTGLIGSVKATPDGYYSILGSPSYSLPIIGSVAVSSTITTTTSFDGVGGIDAQNLPTSGLVIAGIDSTTGSVALLRMTSSKLDVNATSTTSWDGVGAADTKNLPGSGLLIGGKQPATGSMAFAYVTATNRLMVDVLGSPNYNMPVIGSVYISNATSVGSIVGSPNYNLPIIGSVAVSNSISTTVSFDAVAAATTKNLPGSALLIGGQHPTTGSMAFAQVTAANRLMVDVLGSIQLQAGTVKIGSICGISESLPVGGNIIGSVAVDIQKVGLNVPIIGSVQLTTGTSLIGSVCGIKESLPAGGNILGSVAVDIQKVGLNVPIIGSVQLTTGTLKIGSICGISESLPAGTNILGSVLAWPVGTRAVVGSVQLSGFTGIIGSVVAQISADGTAMLGSVKVGAIPVGTNIIGSVAADIQKIGVALPTGTNTIGSVGLQGTWTGAGSVVNYTNYNGSFVSFNWTTAVTGSVLWIPASANRVCITDVILSSSGANLVTLYYDTNNSSNQIAKASLVAGGGFVNNYSKPLIGPANGSVKIDTAVATPGYVTINGFERA